MTNTDLIHARLQNQQLGASTFSKPAEVVKWLGAVQAQDYAGAKWAIAQRTQGISSSDIDQALTQGSILRLHLMRPTWHLVAPQDVRWILSITAPQVKAINTYYCRKHGLDEVLIARCIKTLMATLQGGHQKTRTELFAILHQADIPVTLSTLALVMMQAEQDGIVCSGGIKGKQHTYALLDEWVPSVKPMTKEEALAQLTLRYFTSHGPASLKDYVWWSGLPITEARKGLEMVRSHLFQETLENETYWFPSFTSETLDITPKVCLLPNYDEYIVGYTNRSAITDKQSESARSNILFTNTILIDGQITGTWRRSFKKETVQIEAHLFRTLSSLEEEMLYKTTEKYAYFLEMPGGSTLHIHR